MVGSSKHGEGCETMKLDQFKVLFFEKYFTADVGAQRVDQFSLRQGDNSISEYVRKFEKLITYVPYLAKEPVDKINTFL